MTAMQQNLGAATDANNAKITATVNDTDIKLGTIHGCDFYMAKDQFDYWKHTQLTIDVVKGRGASFSLEIPLGVRFVVKSRLFTEEETIALNLSH